MGASPVIIPLGGTAILAQSATPNPAPVTFLNLNTTSGNAYYVGYTQSIVPGGSNAIPVPVGASITITPGINEPVYVTGSAGDTACVVPGGVSYSGSTDVTASVTIPGTVNVTGTVDIGNDVDVNVTGGTVEVSNTVDISGNINVTGGTVDIGSNVDVTGTGGFILPGQTMNLVSSVGTSISPLNTLSVFNGDISPYNSLDINLLDVSVPGTATTLAAAVPLIFTWVDPNNAQVRQDVVSVPLAWNGVAGGDISVSVPCYGTSVSIEVSNIGSTGTITIGSLTINGSYRSIGQILVQGLNPNPNGALTINSITYLKALSSVNIYPANWLANITNPALTAATMYAWTMGLYSGPVTGWFRPTGHPLAFVVVDLNSATTIAGIANTIDGNPGIIYTSPPIGGIAANNVEYFSFYLPPSPCAILINTTLQAGDSFELSMIGQPQ